MPKQISKRDRDRKRRSQFERARRQAHELSQDAGAPRERYQQPADIRTWPIVRAYVPVEDVFRATGFGSAGIVRQQPNGKLKYVLIMMGLLDGGIKGMVGKDNMTQWEIDDQLKKFDSAIPPFEPGPAGLAARYVWGAHALTLNCGYTPDAEWMGFLSMVPLIAGNSNAWLKQFVGPQGLADFRLVKFLEKNPPPEDIPEDKEVLVWTVVTFACSNTDDIAKKLETMEPEFSYEDDDGAGRFIWSRAYPKNHWRPLSKMGGRQTLGSVRVFPDQIVAESNVLSMASILIGKLKAAFGNDIRLTDTHWKSTADLIRERDAGKDADA